MSETKKELSIKDLPGVGPATVEKLAEGGFTNLISIAAASVSNLAEAAGVGDATARKIIQTARKEMSLGFESGLDILKKRQQVIKITTGSKQLDAMLGGGIETGAVSEFYGAYGSGKSSIAHQLAVSVQLSKDKGGADGVAVWIDTEGTLRPEYIENIAIAYGLDPKNVLQNFRGVRAFNSDHQMVLAEKIEDLIKEGVPVKLVIVDSLMSHFRSDFSGRGMLADRQQKLNKHMHALLKLAHNHDIAVYITNQVMAKPDTFFGDPTEAIGGHVLAHACLTPDTLLQLADGSILPIKDLKKPSSLPAINFEDMQVNTLFCDWGSKREDIKKIFEIDTGNKIKASGGHRFFRLNGFEIEEVETKNLREGDYLMHLDSLKVDGEYQKLPEVEQKTLIKLKETGEEFIGGELVKKGLKRIDVCKNLSIAPRQFRRVLNQGYPTDSIVINQLVQQGISEEVYHFVESFETCKHRLLTIPYMLNEDFAQLLGYHLGDGNVNDGGIRYRDERREILEHYSGLCKNLFGIEGSIYKIKDKNCYELSVNGVVIKNLVERIMDELFLLISKSPDSVVRAFIKGFMDAEGYVNKERAELSISQKDGEVLNYLQMLLIRFGIRSTRNVFKNKNGKFIEVLLFQGRDFYEFAKEIGATASDKKDMMKKWVAHCENTYQKEIIPIPRKDLWKLLKVCGMYPSKVLRSRPDSYKFVSRDNLEKVFEELMKVEVPKEHRDKLVLIQNLLFGDVRWEKIRKIKIFDNKEPLYDISVPLLENYIANGFVVHNSTYRIYLRRGKKGSRVAKLVDAPAMPDSESIFIVTNEGIRDV